MTAENPEPQPLTSPTEPPPLTAPEPPPAPTFEQRMQRFGQDAGAAGERLGREAQAAGERLSKDPAIVGAADVASRTFGVILLLVGLWFVAEVTLGYDLPRVSWGDFWPLFLIAIGLVVVLRGVGRRA